MTNSADPDQLASLEAPDQLASLEANWSGSTMFVKTVLGHESRNKGMKHSWKKFPASRGNRKSVLPVKNPML